LDEGERRDLRQVHCRRLPCRCRFFNHLISVLYIILSLPTSHPSNPTSHCYDRSITVFAWIIILKLSGVTMALMNSLSELVSSWNWTHLSDSVTALLHYFYSNFATAASIADMFPLSISHYSSAIVLSCHFTRAKRYAPALWSVKSLLNRVSFLQ